MMLMYISLPSFVKDITRFKTGLFFNDEILTFEKNFNTIIGSCFFP